MITKSNFSVNLKEKINDAVVYILSWIVDFVINWAYEDMEM